MVEKMDPEVQKILEELSKITNSQQLENYRKSLIKAGGALEKNSKLSEEEQKEIKRAIEQRKRLFSVSSKLEQNFKNKVSITLKTSSCSTKDISRSN